MHMQCLSPSPVPTLADANQCNVFQKTRHRAIANATSSKRARFLPVASHPSSFQDIHDIHHSSSHDSQDIHATTLLPDAHASHEGHHFRRMTAIMDNIAPRSPPPSQSSMSRCGHRRHSVSGGHPGTDRHTTPTITVNTQHKLVCNRRKRPICSFKKSHNHKLTGHLCRPLLLFDRVVAAYEHALTYILSFFTFWLAKVTTASSGNGILGQMAT